MPGSKGAGGVVFDSHKTSIIQPSPGPPQIMYARYECMFIRGNVLLLEPLFKSSLMLHKLMVKVYILAVGCVNLSYCVPKVYKNICSPPMTNLICL